MIQSTVSFGVISDIHLSGEENQQEEQNLRAALKFFKEKKIDVLMVAGDITDHGQREGFIQFHRAFHEVFHTILTAPKKVFVLGNHDYWNDLTTKRAQRKFMLTLGVPVNTNLKVHGFHFIGISTENGCVDGTFTDSTKKWLKAQLDKAVAEDSSRPIFVTFHQHIKGTVYLSDEWGNDSLEDIFIHYPQVITFSGHSHAVLEDERSIYQKDYTSVGTSTLSYTELESGKEAGTIPSKANLVAQGILGTINHNTVVLERYDFHNHCKIKNDWVIDFPVDKVNFRYTDARYKTSVAPYFQDGSVITVSNLTADSVTLTWKAAKHTDFVHSYRVQFYDLSSGALKRDVLLFSDFYLGLGNMKPELMYPITDLDPGTSYKIHIYAIESFGKYSRPITTTVKTLSGR